MRIIALVISICTDHCVAISAQSCASGITIVLRAHDVEAEEIESIHGARKGVVVKMSADVRLHVVESYAFIRVISGAIVISSKRHLLSGWSALY